jgi:S1-C subfamily serine protease
MALIYGVNPQENAHVIEFMNCSRNDHFTIPDISRDEDEMLILPDCAIKKGFSGGPILDSLSREVIGVISGVIGGSIGPDPQKPVKKPTAVGTKINRPFLSIENASTEFD